MSGLNESWVDLDERYSLNCIVESAKPEVTVHWLVDDIQHDTNNTVEDVGSDGIKKTTGTLDFQFSKVPAIQNVSCRVTEDHKILEDKYYKSVDIYCK